MTQKAMQTGFAAINQANLYVEIAGSGPPFVMLHAGVADRRQWNREFPAFADQYRVLRYDMRGFGRSEPVDVDFSHLADLIALLAYLQIDRPLILMGCSMGGGLAIEFALAHPSQVQALILVGSAPAGLDLDVDQPEKFAAAEEAFHAGDLERQAELETQIWFDGMGRSPSAVNQEMRALALEMNRLALIHHAKELGKRLPDSAEPAYQRLAELQMPVLIITGEHDIPYIHAAADYMLDNLPVAEKAQIAAAAHLPNMEHPAEFQAVVRRFLDKHAGQRARG